MSSSSTIVDSSAYTPGLASLSAPKTEADEGPTLRRDAAAAGAEVVVDPDAALALAAASLACMVSTYSFVAACTEGLPQETCSRHISVYLDGIRALSVHDSVPSSGDRWSLQSQNRRPRGHAGAHHILLAVYLAGIESVDVSSGQRRKHGSSQWFAVERLGSHSGKYAAPQGFNLRRDLIIFATTQPNIYILPGS
jgi:hypothetical protein